MNEAQLPERASTKLSSYALEDIDVAINEDDELTATQLQVRLATKEIYVSLTTLL